jgi:hypothetical protein
MLVFAGYLLPSNKEVFPHGPFRMKRYSNTGELLYNTAEVQLQVEQKYEISHKASTLSFHSTTCSLLRLDFDFHVFDPWVTVT